MAPGTGMTWAIAKANDIQSNHKTFLSEPARRCQCVKHPDTSRPRRISPCVIKLQTPVNLRALRGIELSPPLSPEALPSSVASVSSVAKIYYLTAKISKKRKENAHNISHIIPVCCSESLRLCARNESINDFATRCTKATIGRQVMKIASSPN